MPREIFSLRWIITTIIAAVAVGVMIRLGVWQLDRLEERRAFNQRVQVQIDAPVLDLNGSIDAGTIYEMEYRSVIAHGRFDPQNEILLRNQAWEGQPGYHLLTPLRLEGSEYAILIDRGYISMENGLPEQRAQFSVSEVVEVRGILRRGRVPRFFGVPDPTLGPGQTRLDAWNSVNLSRIGEQIPYALLPVYMQAAPSAGETEQPYAVLDQPEISEGPHLGYAIQWFAFAAILGIGYPFFVRKSLSL